MTKSENGESPYSRQIERGFNWLLFEPALEDEFRQHYLSSIHIRVVLCLLGGIGFSLWAVFASRGEAPAAADPDFTVALRTWIIRPLSAVLIVLAAAPTLFRRYWLILAPVTLAVTGTVSSYSAAGAVADGNYDAFVVMVTGLLATLLLLGLLFWQQLALGLIIGGSYALFVVGHQVPERVQSFEFTVLIALAVLVLIFVYNLEKSLRTNFIQTRILEEMGRLDSLTALKNRRAFDEGLVTLWRQAVRDDQQLAMLLVDVDHFKKYNDKYGHQAGDVVLKRVADVLQRAEQRPLDLAARIGGEEFTLLCYGANSEHVQALGQRILNEVRELQIRHTESPVSDWLTVSIGAVVVGPTLGRSPEGLFQFADEALYEAKATGRDRMVFRDEGYASIITGEFKAGRRLKSVGRI